MSKSSKKAPHQAHFAPFQRVDSDSHSLLLKGRGVAMRAEALAPDVFRLRWVRGKEIPESRSWAVVRRDWPSGVSRVFTQGKRVVLETSVGRFSISPERGDWKVVDRHGLVLFQAEPGATTYSGDGSRTTLNLVDGESLFGLGETTGAFNRRGLIRDFWNSDVLGHAPAIHPALKQLYVSIPFAISLRDGRAAGLFWDNPARQVWDLGQTRLDRWEMTCVSGEIDLYLFLGPGVDTVLARYTELTGAMPLPPRWALGYQQSRYGYETQKQFEGIAAQFRKRKLPCDVLYLDILHMQDYRVFTFGKTFPQPRRMLQRLARKGFKVVSIVDPGVKNDPRFPVLRRGVHVDAFVKDGTGKNDFLGEVWPGESRFPDFMNARVREWWGREQKSLQDQGVSGFWNDMNEPANFARPDKTLAPECLHRTDFGSRAHHEVHNLYGMQMARASQEGVLSAQDPSKGPATRPYVITRSGYAGIQRHALVWTGDNSSTWDHLNDAVQMLLNLSLSGVSHCGGDVGGFLENTTPELFIRWFQFATFTPFFRNHTNIGTLHQEPWALGKSVEDICRTFLHLRYQLQPYLYCLLAEARATGAPLMRPLLWHYQNDPVAVACGDQFLLGRDLLVAPVLRQGAVARSVYLPNDVWINFWTGERLVGGGHVVAEAALESIPLFVRSGAVLPLGAPEQYTGEKQQDTILLHCWPGVEGCRVWYEDDGQTQAYASGEVHQRSLSTQTRGRTWTLNMSAPTGPYRSHVLQWRLLLWGAQEKGRFQINGRVCRGSWVPEQELFLADIPNSDGPITVTYSSVR